MAADLTSMAYALKTLWPQSRVENLVYKNQPFLALVPKSTDFRGANMVVGVRYADLAGRSAAFATAQANKSAHKGVKFTITRAKDYALASIDGETLEASKGDEASLVAAMDAEVESAMHAIRRSAGMKLYRSGSGSIGQRGSQSSATITLKQTQDVVNFEVGMVIQAGPNDSSTSLRSGTGTITAVDRDAGTITYSGTITSIADNDYLFVQGDASAAMTGLSGWLPTTAPTSGDSFFGLDRSADPVRLAGKRVDISANTASEGLVKAVNSLAKEGGAPTHLFCHYDQFTNIEHELGAKVQYEDLTAGEVGFKALKINNPAGGVVNIIPDINCPYNLAYLLQLDTWKLYSLGAMPRFLDADGNKMLREASADSYELRVGYYANLVCTAPGWNAVLTMPT